MKKNKLIIICIVIVILIGGFIINNKIKEKDFLTEQGPRIEKYLKYNYKGITQVSFINIVTHPTGVSHVKGYVNGDKEMNFDAAVSSDGFNAGLNFFNKTPEYKFDNYETKTVEEIEKIEETKSTN